MNSTSIFRFPLRSISAEGHTVNCHNLQESPAATDGISGLVPVGDLETAIDRELKPMAALTLPSGVRCTLLRSPDGVAPAALYVLAESGLTAIGEGLPEPLCAVADGEGWLVMTTAGRLLVEAADTAGEQWNIRNPGTRPPDIRLSAVAAGDLSGQTPALTIKDIDLSRDTPSIPDSGLKSLSGSLVALYGSLCDRAAASKAWIQPVIARYRLLDSMGNAIFSSEPAIMSVNGWQCCGLLTAECTRSSENSLSVPPMTLQASMFTISMSIVSLGSYAIAADSVELLLTPQFHPTDTEAILPYRITRPASPTPALTTALPGATAFLADNSAARSRDLLRLTARFDKAAFRAAAFSTAVPATHSIGNDRQFPSATESAMIRRALAITVNAASTTSIPSTLQAISPPHSFIARAAATAGDAVMWSDITILPGPASHPCCPQTAGSEETEWTGNLRVTMADGTSVDSLIGYPMPMPAGLPPLVSYPDPKAVRLDLWVNNIDTSTIHHAAVGLATSEDGIRAIAINPSLQPTPTTPWTGTGFPEAPASGTAAGLRFPGALVSARAEAPGHPLGALILTPTPVTAIFPSVKSQSSWDFTRAHFHALSPAGIFSIGISADRRKIASSLTDPRGVSSRDATAFTPSGIAALTDSLQLLLIRGSRTATLLDSISAHSVGWESRGNRLWLGSPSGLCVISLDTLRSHTRSYPAPGCRICSLGPELWIASAEKLAVAGVRPASSTSVKWSARIPVGKPRRFRHACFVMAASRFYGTIRIRTDSGAGSGQSFPLLSLTVSGEINAPVIARMAATPRNFMTIDIEADVSPDFILSEITLS
ncbi:MAG: hypothetical protein K2L85_09580 [Paramuribaculum sp.]|nr:hypothetical protein [Paramuribaculum sp.]